MKVFQEMKSRLSACVAFGLALVAFSGCSDSGSETAGATSETTNGMRTSPYRKLALPCTSVPVPFLRTVHPMSLRSKPPRRMIPERSCLKFSRTSARMQGAMSRESPAKIPR